MRILLLSHGYPPTVSGVTLIVRKFARAMVRMGHEVAVITASERRTAYETVDDGVRVIRIHSLYNPFWSEGPIPYIGLRALKGLIEDFRPDVIHTHENVILSAQLLRLRRDVPVPFVSSCYYLPRYVTHYLRWGRGVERLIEAALWKFQVSNLNRYNHVIFSTRSQEQEYVQHGLRVPTTVISNGVDTTRYYPRNGLPETEVERRYALPDGRRVLFVGRLMKDKKIDLLIQALAQIPDGERPHLVAVGRGDERPKLEELASRLGVGDHLHLLGFVPEEDLPAIHRATDLFAIASICEVQSIPAIQAALTAQPIVAVNAAALPELVKDGVNGFLVPPDDPQALAAAIHKITQSPEAARQMGEASQQIGRLHAESETFRAYDRFYRSFVEESSRKDVETQRRLAADERG